ncbi:MAG: hypothetical protein VKL58_07990 [Cyanobacteriota bacterium]|nr:hypothetical protein [Cyanobacteriota bacterium]
MKTTPAVPKQAQALLMALMSALAFHALVLSYLQLQRHKATLPEGLQSRDNTPELLQFSSEPAPVSNLELLPMPQASILPPPRVQPPAKPSGAKQKPQTQMAPKTGIQTTKVIRSVRPTTLASPPSQAVGPTDLAEAVEAIRLFTGPAENPLSPVQKESYEKLWAQGRSHPKEYFATLDANLAESIEIRSLSLKQAQNKELVIRHQQFMVMDDRIALFWLDGQRVWILQSVKTPASTPDSGSDSKG